MRRQHEIVEFAEGMIDRQRLDENTSTGGARDLRCCRVSEPCFVDDGPARGVDE